MKNSLVISEMFYSIQGEGKTTGVPAIFLRLAGCNLLCQSATWICDSIEVWQKGIKTDFEDVFDEYHIDLLRNGVHLILTGGEPMLHQNKVSEFLRWFRLQFGFLPYLEVETNGTLAPNDYLRKIINQWNISPKLNSSGETLARRYKPEALKVFRNLNYTLKFVVSEESDINEIFNNFGDFKRNRIMLMPAGDTQDLLENTRLVVIELCKKYILRFTDRVHIVAWNKKTGV